MPRQRCLVGGRAKHPRSEGGGGVAGGGRHGARAEAHGGGEIVGHGKGQAGGRARWTPPGVDFATLPDEVRAAVAEIVQPLYEQLVLGVSDALEKSTGLTVVHLVWQEILDQQHLGRGYLDDPLLGALGNREQILVRHLQLVDAKVKASYVLVRLRELRHLWDAPARQPAAPATTRLPRPFSAVLGVEPIAETCELSKSDGGTALRLSPTATASVPKTSEVFETSEVCEKTAPPEAPPDPAKTGPC